MTFKAVAWEYSDTTYNLQFTMLDNNEKQKKIEEFSDWSIVADSIKTPADHLIVFNRLFANKREFNAFLKNLNYEVNFLRREG